MGQGAISRGLLLAGVGLVLGGPGFAQRRLPVHPKHPVENHPRPTEVLRPRILPIYLRHRDEIVPGLNPRVRVLSESRFDWSFAFPPGASALTPKDSLTKYDSTQTYYQLFVPRTYRHARPSPLILFLSASSDPTELGSWSAICRKYGVMYASPSGAGHTCPPATRLRMALDVLDDVRRRMNVDTDRLYVGGFGDGARTACEIATAYPEFLGGVVAIGGAGPLRGEPWLRDRVRERLSIALAAGERDPARAELETYRLPVLRGLEVRAKLWTVPRLGHVMPPPTVLEEVFVWLEAEKANRGALGEKYPTARMPGGTVPSGEEWARAVVEEARDRVADRKLRESGLMQLEGVVRRWKGGAAARSAAKLLEDAGAAGWEKVYARKQQDFFFREAKALDEWLEGPLPLRDQQRKHLLVAVSLALWKQVLEQDPDTKEGKQAKTRVEELRKMLPE
jgi:hypothetical protein